MNLSKALELVLTEAESSALGDDYTNHSQAVMEAIELLHSFYEDYGHQFQHYTGEDQ
tara:strand:+ start:576 stop:746 length:171 start_codon:yes stop_codon:yes gene_type:complete